MPALAVVGVFAAVVLVVWTVLESAEERATVRASLRALQGYEVEDVRAQELLDPLRQRVLTPALGRLTALARRFSPAGYVDGVRRKMSALGRLGDEPVDRFLALRVASLAAIPLWAVLGFVVLPLDGTARLAVVGLLSVVSVLGPDAVLDRRVEERRVEIRRRLPDVLDLLTISVEAGLGFEQALDRTVSSVPGALSDEFARMLGEVRAGAGRAEALRALDERVGVEEVHSFVLAVVQADTFGISIGRVLRAQADEMRVKRRQLAQEKAQKAPVKMLIPMVFCIFPALFVIIIGPAALNIMESM